MKVSFVTITPETQKEHRLIAEECKKIFAEKMPVIAEAVEWKI